MLLREACFAVSMRFHYTKALARGMLLLSGMKATSRAVWSTERGLRYLKPNISLERYRAKYPSARAVEVPGLTTLTQWTMDGVARTIDHCRVEPDGTCEHGLPSWLIVLGYI